MIRVSPLTLNTSAGIPSGPGALPVCSCLMVTILKQRNCSILSVSYVGSLFQVTILKRRHRSILSVSYVGYLFQVTILKRRNCSILSVSYVGSPRLHISSLNVPYTSCRHGGKDVISSSSLCQNLQRIQRIGKRHLEEMVRLYTKLALIPNSLCKVLYCVILQVQVCKKSRILRHGVTTSLPFLLAESIFTDLDHKHYSQENLEFIELDTVEKGTYDLSKKVGRLIDALEYSCVEKVGGVLMCGESRCSTHVWRK